MNKGIRYLMTTAVSGLIKIGKTETKNYQERMRFLESNGYYNVVGVKRLLPLKLKISLKKKNSYMKFSANIRWQKVNCLLWMWNW